MQKEAGPEVPELDPIHFDLEMSHEKAVQIFREIFENTLSLKKKGASQQLSDYIHRTYTKYFSFSPGPFNYLSRQEHFETLIQINKFDELQGIFGQRGVSELVYRIADPRETEGETLSFIQSLFNGKDISLKIQTLIQLQTIAVYSLTSEWSEQVYNAIQSFLEKETPNDNFIITILKKRIINKLDQEKNTPSMGVVTTLQNTHQAMMFEQLLTEEESLFSRKLLDRVSFLGETPIKYVFQVSSDHYGLYDSRSQLVGLIKKEVLDQQITQQEKPFEANFTSIHDKEYLIGFGLNEDLVEVLKILEDPYFRTKIENLFGIKLKEVDLRIQVSILKFLAGNSSDDVNLTAQEIRSFSTEEVRVNAFKVLLAHENFEFIEGIMYSYNQLPEIAVPLYKKYAEMISDLDEVTSFLTENFKNEYEKSVVLKIREGLIQKASEILLKYSGEIHTLLSMEEFVGGMEVANTTNQDERYTELNNDIEQLRKYIFTDIEKISKDTILLLSAFRSLIKGNPEVSIEDIRNSEMKSYSSEEMRTPSMQQTVKEMRSIYASNIQNEAIREALLAKFDARIADKENTSEFNILYFKHELLAFIIFTKNQDGSYYASGLNVSPTMQGSGIGEVMMRETIIQKTKTVDVHGEVIATKDVVRRYLRDGAIMFDAEVKHGEIGMKIRWGKRNAQYRTKNILGKLDDEIYEEVVALKQDDTVQIQDVEDQSKIDFDLSNKGFVVTQILKRSNGVVSAIFEKKSETTT